MPGFSTALAAFVGEVARPLAVLATSTAAAVATVEIAVRIENGNDGALFIGAVFAGVGAIYIGKSVEVFKKHQASAEVEKARGPPPAPSEDHATLPADQRIDPRTGF